MKVSVVMPVYNAETTISTALDSLSAQTLEQTEIIVVNDGSTDGTLKILRSRKDIVLLDHAHRGVSAAANDGVAAAKGEYIARMDADDLSHPDRLERQASYLDAFPDIGMVGCRVNYGGDRSLQGGYAEHVDWTNGLMSSEDVALNRFVDQPMPHPSIMFRAEYFERFGAYRDGPFPEDYELFLRWMANGVKAAKVDAELLTWNDPPTRLSRTDPRYSVDAFYETKAEYLAQWLAKNNGRHPNIMIWGAGRVTRQRARNLEKFGINITQYVDLKPRTLDCGTPVLGHTSLPQPESCFIVSMVASRGARQKIKAYLLNKGFREGMEFICMA